MKIVIFEPHPDDLLFGPGPIIFDWIEEGHEIHVITVTDGRACCRGGGDVFSPEIANLSEDEIAEMRTNEAKNVIEFLRIPTENHHLLNFHDADGQKYVTAAIGKIKPIITDADRLVLPSTNNGHKDHQATRDAAIGAAKELKLTKIEYFIYFLPTYGKFNDDSKDKQIIYDISDQLREKLLKWYALYKSQSYIKYSNKMYLGFLKKLNSTRYALFHFQDIDKFYNF